MTISFSDDVLRVSTILPHPLEDSIWQKLIWEFDKLGNDDNIMFLIFFISWRGFWMT